MTPANQKIPVIFKDLNNFKNNILKRDLGSSCLSGEEMTCMHSISILFALG